MIIPSISEGFGYSAFESCLFKKPVIISNDNSLEEICFGKALIFENNKIEDLKNKIMLAEKNKFINKKRNISLDYKNYLNSVLKIYNKFLNLNY